MTTYRIDLPWKSPPLSENQRLGWAAKARLIREVRHTTGWLAKAALIPACDYCTITLYWVPKGKRTRDRENPTPTLKACCDGIVDSGIVQDDAPEYMGKALPVILPPEPVARMWLEITTGTREVT